LSELSVDHELLRARLPLGGGTVSHPSYNNSVMLMGVKLWKTFRSRSWVRVMATLGSVSLRHYRVFSVSRVGSLRRTVTRTRPGT